MKLVIGKKLPVDSKKLDVTSVAIINISVMPDKGCGNILCFKEDTSFFTSIYHIYKIFSLETSIFIQIGDHNKTINLSNLCNLGNAYRVLGDTGADG